MRYFLIIYLVITVPALGDHVLSSAYNEGLNQAQENKQKAILSESNFNPAELFKDEAGNTLYSENPPEVYHYQNLEQGNKNILEEAGRKSIDKNEATAAVWKSFGNSKIKIDPNEPWLGKSREIIENADAITIGVSSKPGEVVKDGTAPGINCQKSKSCRIDYVKKPCNEETRVLKKICEKIPKIEISIERTVSKVCQRLDVNQGHWSTCGGRGRYDGALLYTDMLDGPTWDDIYLCPRDNEEKECFVGYLVQGKWHKNNRNLNSGYEQGRGRISKGAQGYMKFLHTHHGSLSGTIINETTNQMVEQGDFTHGKIVVLPRSKTQDQSFKFTPTNGKQVGVVVIYIDKVTENKEAHVESWKEVNCGEN